MKKYKCICGADEVVYEHHMLVGDIQALSFTCGACSFGIDRTFVFPPEEHEKVLYYTCLSLFREMGKDSGFTIDSMTLSLHDPLFSVKRVALELLEELVWAGLPTDKVMELFKELGINVEHPGQKIPDDTD